MSIARKRQGLAQRRRAAGYSQERLAEKLGVERSTVVRWERGETEPQPWIRPKIAETLGVPLEQLAYLLTEANDQRQVASGSAPSGPPLLFVDGSHQVEGAGFDGSVTDLVAAAPSEATALVTVGASAGYDRSIQIAQAFAEADELARRYLTFPPAPIFAQAHECRHRVLMTIHDRTPPREGRDLYLIAALLSGICAYACLDLGHADAAMIQTQAGHVCADFAGHDGLRAWMYGTRSLIARFGGRYSQALDLARHGLQHATTGTALDRLRCGEAQSLACLGDSAAARRALASADEARGRLTTPDVADGIFTFTEAKHAYYYGSTLIWFPHPGEARVAEMESGRAIELFEADSPEHRNLADEALAHVYLGTARAILGDLDGVLEAIRPVLDIPPDRRISWQRKSLARLGGKLDAHRFRGSPLATALQDEISAFGDTSSLC